MRAGLSLLCVMLAGTAACGSTEAPPASVSDGGVDVDAEDLGVDVRLHDSAFTPADTTEPSGERDTDLGPIGHCLYDSIDWTCRSGHICTLFGKCTPDDAGPSEAGS